MTRDVGRAEDLAQEALVAALEKWPEDGLPGNPGAWLVATAKNRALDEHRRRKMLDRKHEQLGHEQAEVVVDPDVRADVAGAGDPAVVPGERVGEERGVEVDDRGQHVERALGERAFGTGSRRRG